MWAMVKLFTWEDQVNMFLQGLLVQLDQTLPIQIQVHQGSLLVQIHVDLLVQKSKTV